MPVVANVKAAGMVMLGKLNMTELAYSGLGLNPHFGTPLNPNDRATPRSPGGSSSGWGAAVAGRLVPCAVGSDTGGSVRIPAAFNGVVGYKTSTGRIDKTGLVPLARTYDTIGPLARSVEDCILLDMFMRGEVVSPVRRADLKSLDVVAPTNVVLDEIEPAVLDNYERSLAALGARRDGAARTCRSPRPGPRDDGAARRADRRGSLHRVQRYRRQREGRPGRSPRHRAHAARQEDVGARRDLDPARAPAIHPDAARAARGALLVMPTTIITAPEVAPLDADDELFHKVNLRALCNTTIGNVLDLCAVALPNGRDGKGLPTSILFSAGRGEDERLLGYALAIERIVCERIGRLRRQAMARIIQTASAQMGPIAKSETRRDTVRRLIALMREAKGRGAELVVFTELALVTFFPRWLIEDEAELDSYYETEMPGRETQPLFDEAKKLGVGFYLGYAELEAGRRPQAPFQHVHPGRPRRQHRRQIPQVHLPGHAEPQPNRTHQHLEKRYFEPGNLGFGVWRALAAFWACASATTGAGPRPTASWGYKASRWSCWATTRPTITPAIATSTA